MNTAEPRYFKTAKTWQYVCTEQGCRFSVVSPSKTEADANITLHHGIAHHASTNRNAS